MMNRVYLQPRVYKILFVFVILFVVSNFITNLFFIVLICLMFFLAILGFDIYYTTKLSKGISGKRIIESKLSLGDKQEITYEIKNESNKMTVVELVDELPIQFQFRSSIGTTIINPRTSKNIIFEARPLERGDYHYGNLYGYVSSISINLVKIKNLLSEETRVEVFPSIMQMKKYALMIFSQTASNLGIRKVRTIGENDEFELIRNYVTGDNMKWINWKATSRIGHLLVNQYQDSRSQSVYCIIDKGRSMEMPFGGLTLLDHAINSALVITNIVLQKYDKAGLITFSKNIDNALSAELMSRQLEAILQTLYAQKSDFKESNFSLLYHTIRKKISKRSILFLYTNFEDKYDLERNLEYFKLINKYHLLIVITFINTEIEAEAKKTELYSKSEIYQNTIAKSVLNDKEIITKILQNAGIQIILTRPEDLSINVINKYLEIKAKRLK
jgi:uncharacterized protein (DUF58 family)